MRSGAEWKGPAESRFELSKTHNVIHIVLDAFQSDVFGEILDEDRQALDQSFSGAIVYCWLKKRIARPRPYRMPPGPSPTMAPTMLAVAVIFSAVNRYGSDAGSRSFQSTARRLAAYERMSSRERGSGDRRPRSMAIVTGKKLR